MKLLRPKHIITYKAQKCNSMLTKIYIKNILWSPPSPHRKKIVSTRSSLPLLQKNFSHSFLVNAIKIASHLYTRHFCNKKNIELLYFATL
jgi:hypothetical protein